MKRSKKPLTFVAVAASIGALSLGLEACVYGPPQQPHETNVYGPPPETNVYGPPPDDVVVTSEETLDTEAAKTSKESDDEPEVCVYGPAPDNPVDGPEVDVYGPAPDDIDETADVTETSTDFSKEPEVCVYGPAPDDAGN